MTDQPAAPPSATTGTSAKATKTGSSAAAKSDQAARTTHAAHFVLQGKGGVGKSLVASILAQYLKDQGRLEGCYDTDPVNGSLQSVTALAAKPVKLLTNDALNPRGVDELIEAIINAKEEIVVDNGAASFLPLSRYLFENDIAAFLHEHGASLVLHTLITGGGNGLDTLKGLNTLCQHFAPGAEIVVWVNEFFGPAVFDCTPFEDTKVYDDNKGAIRGLVYLRQLDPVMFLPNFNAMLVRHLTFEEAAKSDDFLTMEKSRLRRIRAEIWHQLASIV